MFLFYWRRLYVFEVGTMMFFSDPMAIFFKDWSVSILDDSAMLNASHTTTM